MPRSHEGIPVTRGIWPYGSEMNYSQSLSYLDSFLNLERLSHLPRNSFFNLRRMEHLLRIAGRPEKKFFPILITGTTGKGSTGFFLESILKENGIAVGYYHSPHVEDVRERIRLDGRMAPEALWARGLSRVRTMLAKHPVPATLGCLTYFEIMTFLAILLFSETGRRIGIFEIGLGGRLDATNVLRAPLVILTPIHLDHTHFLGDTVAKIAREKAGIIKKHCCVISVRQTPEAARAIRKAAEKNHARVIEANPYRKGKAGLAGDFQNVNAGAAVQAARVLRLVFGFRIDPATYGRALINRDWKGRMETVPNRGRVFILDGAHNPLSVRALARSFDTLCGRGRQKRRLAVFGAMQDKDSKKMLEHLSRSFDSVVLTRVGNPRARSVGALLDEAKGLFKCVVPAQNTEEALALARELTGDGEKILVTGSFYLAGEARKILKNGIRNQVLII